MEALKQNRRPLTLVLNIPPHYREPIFRLIENCRECTWIFGENNTDIPSCPTSFMRNVTFLPIAKGKMNTWWLKGLSHLLRLNHKDIILTGEIKFLSSWYVMFRNRLLPKSKRARIYLWSHGWDGTERKLRRAVYRLYFGMADGLLLYGDHSRQIALREGIHPSKIQVIHNSLDHDNLVRIRESMHDNNTRAYFERWFGDVSRPTLAYIGRLSLVKKITQLLEAAALLKSQGRPCNIVIVGDGPDKEVLIHTVAALGLENEVHFCGAIYDFKESAPIVYNADACVSPGHVGLTAIHSLELGTPVITHYDMTAHAPEVEAITPGETGQLFDRDNVESLAKAISRQLDQNIMLGRDAVRRNCYKAIECWTPEWQIEKIIAALK